jgi:hypothetical protein
MGVKHCKFGNTENVLPGIEPPIIQPVGIIIFSEAVPTVEHKLVAGK